MKVQNMEAVIPPIDAEVLMSELTREKFLRKTNNLNNEIYVFTSDDSPQLMQEVGRLREISFRDSGGGTGKAVDIDEHDLSENGFKQLIVWNPEAKDIVGGYRFIDCKNLKVESGSVHTPTAKLFAYSTHFIENYLPYTIELGRSFVQPAYQPTKNMRKGVFSLDNLWDGLGALIHEYPKMKYFLGKVTMYHHFDAFARDLILHFLRVYFPDPDHLVYPHQPLGFKTNPAAFENAFVGNDYDKDYKTLVQMVRMQNEAVPPLMSAYMNLSSTMKTFGTALNASFGEVEETGIMITIDDLFETKKERYIKSFIKGDNPHHLS